jgi:Sec-independent protein secretion pathway component TatC
MLVTFPLILLYQVSIYISKVVVRKEAQKMAEAEGQA